MEAGKARTYRAAMLVLALSVGNLFFHKPISDVCDWARARWGFPLYDRAAMLAIPIASVAVLVPVLARRLPALRQPVVLCVLLSLAVMSLAAQRWLLVANVELIHFPQFALLAAVLLAAGLAPETAWLVATLAGIADETYQHLVIYAGVKGVYIDFNDMLLNAIGAAWGVVIFAPSPGSVIASNGGAQPRQWWRWPRAAGLLLILLPILLWADPPEFTPFLRPTAGGTLYRVLSAPEALMAALLVWGLVSLATRPDRRDLAEHPSLAGVVSAIMVAVCVMSAPSGTEARVSPPPFIITFWCGPPLAEFDDARAAEIAAAGFTVAGPPCEGVRSPELNRRALDVAARHGLRLWIADHRFSVHALERPNWEADLAAAVADYRDHPALDGYFVVDEPTADAFANVAAVVARLHAHDPTRLAYVNLLPDYIKPEVLGTASYDAYVDEFIATVRPRLLSYDYYTFGHERDRATFFTNLMLMRDRAQQHRLPFLLIILSMPHGPYREPNEAELAWQIFHAMAFGARGISYFAYWTPVNVAYADTQKFRSGLIETGLPTSHYFRAMRLNRDVRALANQLATFRSVALADSLGDVAASLPIGPLASIEGGPITVGFFADDHGQVAALLVNRDYRQDVTVRLGLRHAHRTDLFVTETGQWQRLPHGGLTFRPGQAHLLRWRNW